MVQLRIMKKAGEILLGSEFVKGYGNSVSNFEFQLNNKLENTFSLSKHF